DRAHFASLPTRRPSDLEDGGLVPMRYACFGDNVQPGFTFSEPPDGTAAYAMIFHDIVVALDDGPEDGLHWVLWNIPVEAGGIPRSEEHTSELQSRENLV